jgi:hypothetical protein
MEGVIFFQKLLILQHFLVGLKYTTKNRTIFIYKIYIEIKIQDIFNINHYCLSHTVCHCISASQKQLSNIFLKFFYRLCTLILPILKMARMCLHIYNLNYLLAYNMQIWSTKMQPTNIQQSLNYYMQEHTVGDAKYHMYPS